ncbi:MAG: hypothetical protein ACI4NE_02545 [Succinivibrio sp.]
MVNYRPVIINAIALVALFIFAANSYATIPHSLPRIALLFAGSFVLIIMAFEYNRSKHRFKAGFTFALAFLPWVYYMQLRYLSGSFDIPSDTMLTTYGPVMVVYNLFRYPLLIIVFAFFVFSFLNAFRGINSRD